jgi:hypothetical protein
MQTNYSVPCHKGDGDNTLATRYNHKIILVDDTCWLFCNLKKLSHLVTSNRKYLLFS